MNGSFFKNNKRYKRYSLTIKDFRWLSMGEINFALQPLCEQYPQKYKDNLNIIPEVLEIMKEKDDVNLKLHNFPHADILYKYIEKKNFDFTDLKTTRYYRFHCILRKYGVNADVRTDDWIYNKALRLIKLYHSIRNNGYIYNHNNTKSYIAVLERPILELKYNVKYPLTLDGYELYDGAHRAICLYFLGYKKIKALVLE